MEKVLLTKTISKPVACVLRITNPDISQSKLAYAELFRAVLQIPEKDVQQRILEAVNGKASRAQIVHAICPNCKRTFDSSAAETNARKTVETQTDLNEMVSHVNNQPFRIIALPLDTITTSEANSDTNCEYGQLFKKPERSYAKKEDTSFPTKTLHELMDDNRIGADTLIPNRTLSELRNENRIEADISFTIETSGELIQGNRRQVAGSDNGRPFKKPMRSFIKQIETSLEGNSIRAVGPPRVLSELLEEHRVQPEMGDIICVQGSSPLQKPLVSLKVVNSDKILTNETDGYNRETPVERPGIKLEIEPQKSLQFSKLLKEVKRPSMEAEMVDFIRDGQLANRPRIRPEIVPQMDSGEQASKEMGDPIRVGRHPFSFQKPLPNSKLIKSEITQPQILTAGKFINQNRPLVKSLILQPEMGLSKRDSDMAERLRIRPEVVPEMDCGEQPIKRVSLKIVNGYKISTNEPPALPVERPRIQPEMALEQPIKRRRKRKLCLPQVVKRSQAQMAQTQMQPKLRKETVIEKSKSLDMELRQADDFRAIKNLERRDSIGSIPSDVWMEELFKEPYEYKSKEDHIMLVMAEEYLDAEKITDGLIAIHRAIVMNDMYALRRQIFVWKKLRKVMDLNDLLTDEDENCLQLAIKQDCYPKLIEILLNEGLNANEIDYHSNTCIHLAILNEIDLGSIRMLMQKIDLKLLLQLNDDGYTPLHIAVRTDNYLRAEIILNALDERLQTKSSFERNGRSSSSQTKEEFNKYYEDICKILEKRYVDMTRNAQPKLKKRFLEAGDRKSGNTALFFAVENKLEHFIFFLLAHLTDPRITNFSGQDAKSYYSEFGKSLNLSLKVDNAMESVIAFLDN